MSEALEPAQLKTTETSIDNTSKLLQPPNPKIVVLADLNDDPPETDGGDSLPFSAPDLTRFSLFFNLVSSLFANVQNL